METVTGPWGRFSKIFLPVQRGPAEPGGCIMLYSISGKLIEKSQDFIVVETAGVAYEISFLSSNYERLPGLGDEVTVFVQFVVREDLFSLFGFLTKDEKGFFNTLTSVPSIGPKTAFNIMNSYSIDRLIEAILREDEKCLTQISGVGSKTAKRIILELKDKLAKLYSAAKTTGGAAGIAGGAGIKARPAFEEARMALGALGFSFSEIDRMMTVLLKEQDLSKFSTEQIVKLALLRR